MSAEGMYYITLRNQLNSIKTTTECSIISDTNNVDCTY